MYYYCHMLACRHVGQITQCCQAHPAFRFLLSPSITFCACSWRTTLDWRTMTAESRQDILLVQLQGAAKRGLRLVLRPVFRLTRLPVAVPQPQRLESSVRLARARHAANQRRDIHALVPERWSECRELYISLFMYLELPCHWHGTPKMHC